MFRRLDTASLRAQAAHEIERRIFAGELSPGDRLPPERELAEEMGISRGVLNYAIQDLESKGFVRIVARHGVFINDYRKESTPQMLLSLIEHSGETIDYGLFGDLLDTRLLLERECTRLAVARIDAKELETLGTCLDEMARSRTPEACADANYRFHHTLTEASGNRVYAMILRSFEHAIRWYLTQYFTSEANRRISSEQHERLLRALADGRGEEADAEILAIFSHGIEALRQKYRP